LVVGVSSQQRGYQAWAARRSIYTLQYLHSNNSAWTAEIYLKQLNTRDIADDSERRTAIDPKERVGERDLLRRN
jgi:hypothetical protein